MYKIILREFFRLYSSSTSFLASMLDKISSLSYWTYFIQPPYSPGKESAPFVEVFPLVYAHA